MPHVKKSRSRCDLPMMGVHTDPNNLMGTIRQLQSGPLPQHLREPSSSSTRKHAWKACKKVRNMRWHP